MKEKINLALDERFEIPISMQFDDIDNGIFKMQETLITQVVKMQDEALVQAIRDYARRESINKKENVRLMLLDESIADEIIELGIQEYIKIKEREEK